VVTALCYTPHGGSGFSFTRADVLEMSLQEIGFYLEWVEEQRDSEARAIKRASKR
jgi:hypothetical protein